MKLIVLIDDTITRTSSDGKILTGIIKPLEECSVDFLNTTKQINKFLKQPPKETKLVLLDLDLRNISEKINYSELILKSLINNKITVAILSALPTNLRRRSEDERGFLSIWDAINKGAKTYIKKADMRVEPSIVTALIRRCIDDPNNLTYSLIVNDKLRIITVTDNKGNQIASHTFNARCLSHEWNKELKARSAQGALFRVIYEMAIIETTKIRFTDIYPASLVIDKRSTDKLKEYYRVLTLEIRNAKVDSTVSNTIINIISPLKKTTLNEGAIDVIFNKVMVYIEQLQQTNRIKDNLKLVFQYFKRQIKDMDLKYRIEYPNRMHGVIDEFNKAIRKKSKGNFVGNLLSIGEQGETGGLFKINLGRVTLIDKRKDNAGTGENSDYLSWQKFVELRLNNIEREIKEIKEQSAVRK